MRFQVEPAVDFDVGKTAVLSAATVARERFTHEHVEQQIDECGREQNRE